MDNIKSDPRLIKQTEDLDAMRGASRYGHRAPRETELSKADDAKLKAGVCPKCGSKRFVKGPEGGLAVNIACENGHRFWYSPPFTSKYQGTIKVEKHGDKLLAHF